MRSADLCIVPEVQASSPPGLPVWKSLATGYSLHPEDRSWWFWKDHGGFRVSAREISVSPGPLDGPKREYLETSVFALWLHMAGRFPIHASAVQVGGGGIGVMARSGAGKSTLAAALVSRGARLLCDDLFPVEFEAEHPVVPAGQQCIRLWPESARHFVGDIDALPRVAAAGEKRRIPVGSASGRTRIGEWTRLRTLYVLERMSERDRPIEIARLPEADALMALLAHGQMSGVAELLGCGAARMAVLARVVRSIPVRRLRIPTGFEALPAVCEAIEADAAA